MRSDAIHMATNTAAIRYIIGRASPVAITGTWTIVPPARPTGREVSRDRTNSTTNSTPPATQIAVGLDGVTGPCS
jgi:hypothetical protein